MRYSSWYTEWDNFFLSFWAIFYPFTTLTTWKIKILKKWKKFQKRHHHFTQVYHKGQSYDIYFLRYQLQQTDFFVILGHFLPFYLPLTARKMKISRKREKLKKKKWRKHLEISSFYAHVPKIMIICSTVPEIYVCDKCNCYFFFWAIFCPFTSLTAQKMKISKKWKKTQEISSFYTTVSKIMIIGYTAPEIWHVTHAILIFHFGLFFAFLPP